MSLATALVMHCTPVAFVPALYHLLVGPGLKAAILCTEVAQWCASILRSIRMAAEYMTVSGQLTLTCDVLDLPGPTSE